jgi:DNA-binding response OmpR family regulator
MTDKGKILVVDDEYSLRTTLAAQLKEQGYSVSSAEDGDVAIKMLRSQTFDLILLDLKMPNVDGYEVLKFVKQKHPKTKVVVLTGFADLKNALDSRGLGADHFLAKPFERKELLALVRRILADV